MKPKSRVIFQQQFVDLSDRYRGDYSPQQETIKSPSPDKKAANIIVCTRSPDLQDMKSHFNDGREYANSYGRQSIREKPFPASTPTKYQGIQTVYKIEETEPTAGGRQVSPHSNSRVRNTRIQIVAESTPQDFQTRHGISRIREMSRSDSMELDYIKLLKSKEETIKELKEIIDMIKKNNTSVDDVDEEQGDRGLKQINHQLNAEVRELKIENQYLLNVIEKGAKNKKSSSPQVKEQILHRQVRELKESLKGKEMDLSEASSGYQRKLSRHKDEIHRLQTQNESLLRLLKDKQQSLANSSMSVKSTDKQKLSLIKIKQQYNQNLKLMRDNFYGEMQELQSTYRGQLEELYQKIDLMNNKVSHFQNFKGQLTRDQEKLKVREEYHNEKLRHQEMESFMMEKYSKYESDISQQKRTNDRLIQELIKANKANEDLSQQTKQYQQEIDRLQDNKGNFEVTGELVQERNALVAKVNSLEVDNLSLKKQFDDFSSQKGRQIDELQKKIEVILMQYDYHSKQQKNNHQLTIGRLEEEIKRLDSKQKEMVDYYQKDKTDTQQKVKMAIDIYNKQNETIKAAILQKNNELHHASQQLNKMKRKCSQDSVSEEELKNMAGECQELRQRCQNLERETGYMGNQLSQLNNIIKDKDAKLIELHNALTFAEQEKEGLSKKINQTEINNNDLTVRSSRKELETIELGKRVELLEKDLEINNKHYNQTINSLRQELAALHNKNQELAAQLFSKNQELQNRMTVISRLERDLKLEMERKNDRVEPIEEDLQDLRKMVTDYFIKNQSSSQKDIVEEFYRLNYNYEVKLQENLKIMKELQDMKTELADKSRQKEILSEKIAMLEQNNLIYERELKQRRIMYEQLLQEKSKIEREYLMTRKIKVEQSQIDQTRKANLSEITSRIDRLVELEKQRTQRIRESPERKEPSPSRQ